MVQAVRARLEEPDPLIQVIVGPRQVGKTTALKTALGGKGVYHSADYPISLATDVLETWWREAGESQDRLLAVDEVQKISGWSEIVKKLWDDHRGIRLILTGSSALLMEKGLKETLAGRFELIRAEHWNYAEAHEVFGLSIDQYLEFGCYPGSMRFLSDPERWGTYIRDAVVEPALGRDLLQLHPVQQPALLRQVFGAAIALPAHVVSLEKLQGSLQGRGSLPTLSQYLHLLSTAFLVSSLEKFSPSPTSSHAW